MDYKLIKTSGADVDAFQPEYVAGSTDPTAKTAAVSGHTSTGTTTLNGYGTTHYNGAGGTMYLTQTTNVYGLQGKLFWSPLLPANIRIVERGGPNGSGQIGQTDSHEWEDAYGIPGGDGPFHADSMIPWEGNWHYRLQLQTPVDTFTKLSVFEPVTFATSARTALETLSGTNVVGVRIGTARAAIFPSTTALYGALVSGRFLLSAVGTYDVLITGLPLSTARTFALGANVVSVTLIANGDTDLTYISNAEGALFLRIVVSSAGSTAANEVSFT